MNPTYPGLPSRRTEMEEAIFAAHDALSHREAGGIGQPGSRIGNDGKGTEQVG